MKILCFVSLLLCMGSVKAQDVLKTNKDNNTLLWEISGNGLTKPSYLFGTFHLLCKDDANISLASKQAIARSSEIYLELDMDDPATLMQGMRLMFMNNGKKLKDFYSPEAYQRVVTYFKDSLATTLEIFQGMKPYFLMALLYPKMAPCQDMTGMEQEIMKLATEQEKEIKGLETMAMQAAVFDSIPYAKQAEELLQTIDSMDKSRHYFAQMSKGYKEQKLQEIEKLMNDEESGVAEDQNVLLDKRNLNWVEQLPGIMKEKPVFIAVGTGHLLGEKGLIALLRKAGYVLRPLENK